ncbi:hypothetical protein VNO77_09747 [Canavalia gladiata]|uniref:Uncharacterized protein n=1 Tax=Canavalia gladiata TaxID=3824 RepID=A0AAN9QUD7_CANGL
METLKAAIPEELKRVIGDSNVDDLRSTCSSLHRFFSHLEPFHQIVTELADPKYALCGKSKDAALKSKQLGNQCFFNSDYAKALECYTQALRKAPLDAGDMESNLAATLYINRATVLHKMNLLVECLRDCTRALQISPSYAKAWYRRGKANASLGNCKDAICDLNVAKSMESSTSGKRQIDGELKIILDQCKSMGKVVQLQHEENSLNTVGEMPPIKLQHVFIPDKGRGMVSSCDLSPGSLVHAEEPYAMKVGREQLLTENVRTDVGEKKHALVDMIKTGSPNGSMGFWDRAICLISSTILARPSAKLTNKLRVTDRYIVIDYKSSMNFSDDNVADIPKRESVPLATDPTTGINFNAGKPAKDDILKPCEGSPIFEESQQQPADKKPEIAPDSHPSLMEEARSPAQSFGSAVVADDGARDKQSSGVNATVPSDQEFKEVQKDIEEEINPYVSKEKKACVFMRNLTGSLSTPANFCVVVLPKLLPRVSWLLISIADIPKRESLPLATDATTEIDFNAAKPAKDAIPKPYEGPPISEKSQQHVDKEPKIAPDNYSSLMEEARSPAQSFGSAVAADDVVSDKQSPEVNAKIPLDQELKEVQKDIEEEINPSVTKEKKETVKSSTSQTADNVPVEGAIVTEAQTQIDIGEQPRAEIGENHDWQILKSIVYGGLIESITSLGIVSSAAAAGATPLNIIALGLANLIGGLFVIGHNLSELKNEQEDQYQELLGRKENFLLHAVVAVLSFLIFGSVPLVVYGLLISKQYYAEVKIAVVAVASIVCIILLAIGKVYTSRTSKSYIKTVLKYVTMALAASGLSYIAGNLFKELLDKFSRSESSYVLVMPLSSTRKMKPAWMSY